MKKTKKTILTAAILTSAVSLSSCNWFNKHIQNVYGPPPADNSESSQSTYNPRNDSPQPEYGAYEAFEIEEQTTEQPTETTTEQTTEADIYTPVDDIPPVVYGPPSYFE